MRNLYFGISIAPYRVDLCRWLHDRYSCDIYHRSGPSGNLAFNLSLVESECGFPLLYYPNRGRNRSRLRTIASIISKNDPETVFVFEFSFLTLQVILIRLFRRKKFRIICFCDDSPDMIRGNDFSVFHRLARWIVPRFLDNLILPNRESCEWYVSRFGKGVYFPIIADERRWRQKLSEALPLSQDLAARFFPDRKPVVLYVGRMAAVKNVPTLLKAFSPFVGRAHLVLIGEGEEMDHLREMDRRLGTQALFMGKLSGNELIAWYNIADVFALPSTMEPFGAVTNEALMSGLYTLVSSRAGSVTLIESDQNGAVFNPDSIQELTALLDRFITLSEGKADTVCVKRDRMPYTFEESIVSAMEAIDRQ